MPDNVPVEDAAFNDGVAFPVAADEIGGVKHQRVKVQHGADGSATDVSSASPMPVGDAGGSLTVDGTVSVARGTLGYDAGTATGTVDVPAGARARFVSLIAGASAATLTVNGGDTITVPALASFDREFAGDATLGGDVVIGGTITSYYVEWVTP